jgi:hypothetical protein
MSILKKKTCNVEDFANFPEDRDGTASEDYV